MSITEVWLVSRRGRVLMQKTVLGTWPLNKITPMKVLTLQCVLGSRSLLHVTSVLASANTRSLLHLTSVLAFANVLELRKPEKIRRFHQRCGVLCSAVENFLKLRKPEQSRWFHWCRDHSVVEMNSFVAGGTINYYTSNSAFGFCCCFH